MQLDDFKVPTKNEQFPKRDPRRLQARPRRPKTGGAKKSSQRFFGDLSAKRKTAAGGDTAPCSKAVHMVFAQGLLLFFERTIGARTPKMEHPCWRIYAFVSKTGSILGPLFFTFGPLGPKRAPEDLIRALVGSPGRLRRRQKAIFGGSEIGTENEPQQGA